MDLRLDRAGTPSLGTQLEARLRAAIADGTLRSGDRLPSLRHVAAEAGVNVNTVRAVYARLEAAGAIVTEQGRGTFVGPARPALREQIARLEAELARTPAPRPFTEAARPPAYPGLLTTAELAAVRDALLARLQELDAARADVTRRLATLDESASAASRSADDAAAAPEPAPRRSTSTLNGARVRWVGAQ